MSEENAHIAAQPGAPDPAPAPEKSRESHPVGSVQPRHGGASRALGRLRRERDRARREASEATLSRSRFLAIMSHEIRTPLNGVLGALQLLSDTDPSQAQRDLIELATACAENLRRLSNDVIDLSRMETGTLDLEPAPFDIAGLLRETCEFWRPLASSKNLTLQWAIDEAVPSRVCADALRVRQILSHYLSNAIEHSDRGDIRVSLGLDSKYVPPGADEYRVRVEVSDTGRGIDREVQKYLFQERSSLPGRSSGNRGGAGLGLTICREIATFMGGSVGVSSAPGEGSNFWVSLPVRSVGDIQSQQDHRNTPGQQRQLVSPVGGGSARVLLVEDSVTNQLIAKALLEQLGCEVRTVGDGVEAVSAVRERPYDVVLMDVAMPLMDGVEATRRIRTLHGDEARVPIIGQTAYVLEEDTRGFLSAGMSRVVSKPLQGPALYEALAAVLCGDSDESHTPASPGSGPNIIDVAVLGGLASSLGPQQLGELLQQLSRDIDATSRAAIASAEEGDLPRLNQATHTLKGLGASFGSPALESLASAIQGACQSEETSRATGMTLSRLETVCADTLAALARFEQTIGGPLPARQ